MAEIVCFIFILKSGGPKHTFEGQHYALIIARPGTTDWV